MSWPSETPVETSPYAGEAFWVLDGITVETMPDAHVTTYYAAITENDALSPEEITAGHSGASRDFRLPQWNEGKRFIYIGVDQGSGDITDILSGGQSFFHVFERVPGTIEGVKWWKTINAQSVEASGVPYEART